VEWPPGPYAPREPRESAPYLLAGLLLILAIVLFSGYLLLRDVNREFRLAELRTNFVANVSHEIRTPLAAIRLYAEKIAMPASEDPKVRSGYVSTIINESERLTRLADNVLELSRIETGTKVYRMAPASLGDVVHSSARTIDYLLVQRGFTLRVAVDDDVPPVRVDTDAMEQAILNLLTNAVKYSGDSRQIELRVSRFNNEAVIEVADRGVGIHPRDHGRIFEKFYRIHSEETSHVAGTGLGLTLVQHIVKAHAGRVEIKSAPGQGSTFSIYIPAGAA
jgi:signal transduction histidine kinase